MIMEKISKIRNRIIDLQKEWKTIGPVPKESDGSIWERFRKPCDTFFDRYEDHFAAVQNQLVTESDIERGTACRGLASYQNPRRGKPPGHD